MSHQEDAPVAEAVAALQDGTDPKEALTAPCPRECLPWTQTPHEEKALQTLLEEHWKQATKMEAFLQSYHRASEKPGCLAGHRSRWHPRRVPEPWFSANPELKMRRALCHRPGNQGLKSHTETPDTTEHLAPHWESWGCTAHHVKAPSACSPLGFLPLPAAHSEPLPLPLQHRAPQGQSPRELCP